MNRLSISGVSKTYRNGVKALDKVSLELEEGIFGLLGPNGAGKSSLMRILAALQTADEGQVLFNGIDLLRDPQHIRRQLGYLPQQFGVYPRLSTLQLLHHLAILKGLTDRQQRKQQIEWLLECTNLQAHRHRSVHRFSGGMRQRFGIAQALLGDPKLIIVDEPTAGLDPEERHRFHSLLSEISRDRIVLLSTHIVEDVRELCPKMAVLQNGQILLQGAPNALLQRLENKLWRLPVPKGQAETTPPGSRLLHRRLLAGQTIVHLWSDRRPTPAATSIRPSLTDVYFASLKGILS